MDNLNFSFNAEEANLILRALQEMPHRMVDGLIKNIQGQAQAQLNPPKPPQEGTEDDD